MTRTLCLMRIIVVGAVAAFAVPAYAQYANIYVQQDVAPIYNVSAGFDANPGDGGVQNTAFGFFALANNGCCGYYNSAFGYSALQNNTLGEYNTAVGYSALWDAGSGSENTAVGASAMFWTSGSNNSAVGYDAMEQNSTGNYNTAVGYQSLGGNIFAPAHQTGDNNTAVGANALYLNQTGGGNTAIGTNSMFNNKAGPRNVAVGFKSLFNDTSGGHNIALGFQAGLNLITGSNNIDIDNPGGSSAESATIRIGTEGTQTNTYIAGIYGNTSLTSGTAVFVDSTGHLGTASSSERFKTGIEPMGFNTEKLQQLRPVTFHYKADPQSTLRYGLIAEEVAKVYPELVVRDQYGRIDGVRYDELAPMLLNELQQQQKAAAAQLAVNVAQAAEIRELKQQQKQFATQAELNDLKQQLQAALAALNSKDQLVAQR
jgi:hypothetical protein